MKFKLPVDGIIKKINKNKPSRIYLKKYDIIVFFDPFTKIDGCRFDYLEIGDQITIHQMREVNNKTNKYFMCQQIVIIDIQKKWNNILKNDKKYSINHNLASNPYFTRPEIIEPSAYHVKNVSITSNMNSRDKKIITFYNEGKTTRYIAKKIGLSQPQIVRIINSYTKNKGK